MKNKRGFEISFAWLFAILVGAFILFLTIYGVTKIVGIGETQTSAKLGREINVLLNPLEMGFEEGKSVGPIELNSEVRITNECTNDGNFGRQRLPVSQKTFSKWSETDVVASSANKYIFSKETVEGTSLEIFSKPFNFPFKVCDLIYLTSSKDKYCFVDAPEDVEDEIKMLHQDNLLVENCTDKMVQVCFKDTSCEIYVDYIDGFVRKESGRLDFVIPELNFEKDHSIMYAAIFSDKEVYDCQIRRLMQRLVQLSEIYKDKASFISKVGCSTNLNLEGLQTMANNTGSASELGFMINLVEDLEDRNNNNVECKLW